MCSSRDTFRPSCVLAAPARRSTTATPTTNNPSQIGFGTFGGPHIATRLLCEVIDARVESGLVSEMVCASASAAGGDGGASGFGRSSPARLSGAYGDTQLVQRFKSSSKGFMPAGSALLPMAFPEGSPTHPAYGAGHATVAGACVTILKAWFKETTRLVDIRLDPGATVR
jgi:hypothetical protein